MEPEYPITICPQRFTFQCGKYFVSVPCCWSHPIDRHDENIERVVIVIHGVLRNADEYFPNMMAAVGHAGVEKNTLVIAPQFLVEEDITRFELPDEFIFWGGETGEGWKKGDDSLSTRKHRRPATASSFEVVDQMVKQVANPDIFPGLKSIVIAGHSAGGQYVNRYTAGTQIEQSLPESIHLRAIVANPSTYVYFNEERQVSDDPHVFAVPQSADPDYDDYKYGLKNLNPYMSATGADQIRMWYPEKDVVFLLGGEDTREAQLEQTPNAMHQGVNRLARGQIYYRYLQHYFGDAITQSQKIAIIPCVGHDNAAIFKSEAGVRYLFEL